MYALDRHNIETKITLDRAPGVDRDGVFGLARREVDERNVQPIRGVGSQMTPPKPRNQCSSEVLIMAFARFGVSVPFCGGCLRAS
jgi:hypothetical protein